MVLCIWWQEAMVVLMMSLMHELEGLLHEYLSYNWDRIDSVLAANREALRCGEGSEGKGAWHALILQA